MYINDAVMKIGKVKIEEFSGSYRLRWSYQRARYSITIGKISPKSLDISRAKAMLIDSDILMERFDSTLAKYDTKRASIFHKSSLLPSLEGVFSLGIWQN